MEISKNELAGAFYRNENQMNCGDCPYRDRCRKGYSPSKWRLNQTGTDAVNN
ncbi:MAG: hypothetical protein IJS01_10375 [Lentisphaeria bacterium]|nr:hypothetical protein [Lentisphaeria bacterium]